MAIEKNDFRKVMSRFAAGVTVVTTRGHDDAPYGLTATAFSSLSLDPPMILVCIGKASVTYPHFRIGGCLAVNFLRHDQEAMSRHFAVSGGDKFGSVAWTTKQTGAPILEDTLGWVDCKILQACEGGDHTIYLGQVEAAEVTENAPLVYYAGRHRVLAD